MVRADVVLLKSLSFSDDSAVALFDARGRTSGGSNTLKCGQNRGPSHERCFESMPTEFISMDLETSSVARPSLGSTHSEVPLLESNHVSSSSTALVRADLGVRPQTFLVHPGSSHMMLFEWFQLLIDHRDQENPQEVRQITNFLSTVLAASPS